MTILEAIRRADGLQHNTFTQEEKVSWLSQVDALVEEELIRTHENAGGKTFRVYDEQTPLDQELLVPPPFDELYRKLRWTTTMQNTTATTAPWECIRRCGPLL